MFDKSVIGTNTLYNSDTCPTTETLWATQFANNISTYFLCGTALPMVVGDYNYVHIPPLVAVQLAQFIADMVSLYVNTNKTAEEWGNDLGTLIADYFGTFVFNGTKQLIAHPYTTTPWSGIVNSSLAKPVLISTLTPHYIPETAPSTWQAFATAIESAIDTAAKMCYLEFPVILLQ